MDSPTIAATVELGPSSRRRWTKIGGGTIVVLSTAYFVVWHTTGYSPQALVASLMGGVLTLTIGVGAVLVGYVLGWLTGNRGFGMYLCAAITTVALSLLLVPFVAMLIWVYLLLPAK